MYHLHVSGIFYICIYAVFYFCVCKYDLCLFCIWFRVIWVDQDLQDPQDSGLVLRGSVFHLCVGVGLCETADFEIVYSCVFRVCQVQMDIQRKR